MDHEGAHRCAMQPRASGNACEIVGIINYDAICQKRMIGKGNCIEQRNYKISIGRRRFARFCSLTVMAGFAVSNALRSNTICLAQGRDTFVSSCGKCNSRLSRNLHQKRVICESIMPGGRDFPHTNFCQSTTYLGTCLVRRLTSAKDELDLNIDSLISR